MLQKNKIKISNHFAQSLSSIKCKTNLFWENISTKRNIFTWVLGREIARHVFLGYSIEQRSFIINALLFINGRRNT